MTRRWFHILLVTGLVPLPPFLSWGSALYWLGRAVGDDRRWAKRMVWLAAAETLVFAATLTLLFHHSGDSRQDTLTDSADRVAVGIALDSSYGEKGARILTVQPGGPAERAKLKPGDVVLRIGNAELKDMEALRTRVAAQPAGTPLVFEIARQGVHLSIEVIPERFSSFSRPPRLFERTAGTEGCRPIGRPFAFGPWVFILSALVLSGGFASLKSLGHGSARGVWWTVAAIVAGNVGAYGASFGSCYAVGGPNAAMGVMATVGSSLGLLSVAWLGFSRSAVPSSLVAPLPSLARVVGTGVVYTVTWGVRLYIVLAALRIFIPNGTLWGASPIDALGQGLSSIQGPGIWLLALPVVFLGPMGEELAFRGLFQPAMAQWMKPWVAIVWTTLVFASLHWVYGLMLPVVMLYGVVLGWARVVSGRAMGPILIHMFINATYFAMLWRRLG